MGFVRSMRRFYREWKVIFFVLGFVLFVQVFITFSSSPSLLEDEQIKRIRHNQMIKQKQAANALLQGEKPHYADLEALNPRNPKFREEFLKHTGNVDSIIEDGNLKNHYDKILVPRHPKKEDDVFDVQPYDDIKYQPICEVTLKDAQSAITRAKSDKCKQEISDVACQMQEKMLFPESMPRTCPYDYKYVFNAPMPSSVDDSLPKVRICYMLVVHGRSFRQFKRLLRVIYHREHYYYIHVDKRSDYLLREILKETKRYINVKVAPWRMATIWGGSSLLQMLLRALRDVLYIWHDWDFFINLSALDFPIENDKKLYYYLDNVDIFIMKFQHNLTPFLCTRPLGKYSNGTYGVCALDVTIEIIHNKEMIDFLSTYRDKNFMKSHGREDEKFIRKQGLNRVFVECDHHMWRLGERDLPKGITVNGGSDWVALNRKFCQYVITGKDKLLSDLKHWYKYTLLPAESFFHTLAQNSDRCETFVDNNLRVTNWNRARGCKCQYKHIVDWCGCSPNDFYPSDLTRLKTTRPVFFARKFEEVINQEVVNHLDFKIYGEYPSGTPGLTSYWENCYDHLDGLDSASDAAITHYTSFARLGLSQLTHQLKYSDMNAQCSLYLDKVYQIDVYKTSETFAGYVVTLGASWSPKTKDEEPDGKFQVHVFQLPTLKVTDAGSKLAKRLSSAMVGTNWDVKELALRDWGGLVGPNSDPHLVARWRKGDDDFVVTVAVIDPLNVVADYNDFRTPSKAAGVTETPLSLRKPMRPGRWTIKFYIQRQFTQVCAEVEFFVTPVQYVKGVEGDKQLQTDNRGIEDDAQLNSANRNLYSIRTTLGLQKDSEALHNLMSNSLNIAGDQLKSWIDAVLGRLWRVKEVCFVAESSAQWKSAQPNRCSEQRQPTPPLCQNQNWSSFSPDPKSELGKVKRNGRIR